MTVLFIHGFSAESRREDQVSISKIYGDLPQRLAAAGGQQAINVNVSRWISLDDGLDLEDLTLALDRALHQKHAALLTEGFDAVVHSTGALVIRNWIRRFTTPATCPINRVIYLAGANWGSGWAHIGKSQMARWARWAMGTQRGLQVLSCLEFGSTWTVNLHAHFLEKGHDLFDDYGVMEFCIIGSQVDGPGTLVPVRYGCEDGSDGVVRVASGNLNHHYLKIGPNPDLAVKDIRWDDAQSYAAKMLKGGPAGEAFGGHAFDATYYRTQADYRPCEPGNVTPQDLGSLGKSRARVPLAVVYGCAHSGKDVGVVAGRSVSNTILTDLIRPALACTKATYEDVAAQFDEVTIATRQKATTPEHISGVVKALRKVLGVPMDTAFAPAAQYDPHAQVMVRVTDQHGQPVKHCDVYFNSFGGGEDPGVLINTLIEDHHQNTSHPGAHTFYLRCEHWEASAWTDRLSQVRGLDLEISVVDPVTQRVLYIPLRMRLSPDRLQQFIRADRTTVIDVQLIRLPEGRTFIVA